jgi:hypothetical protein
MKVIFKIPIIGDFIAFLGYIFLRLTMPSACLLSGMQRLRYGTLIVWTPQNKKDAIVNGLELLRACDPEMYRRLTSKQHLIIVYSWKWKMANACGRFFGLHERYIEMGDQGVAMFFVQSLSLSEACPSINQSKRLPGDHMALRNVLDWMHSQSFRPSLIESYHKVVEKWEQKHPA